MNLFLHISLSLQGFPRFYYYSEKTFFKGSQKFQGFQGNSEGISF